MKKTGSTIDITPDPEGIIRWLRACYRGDDEAQEHALMVMRAGWPTLDEAGAIDVLTGKTELVECVLHPAGSWVQSSIDPKQLALDTAMKRLQDTLKIAREAIDSAANSCDAFPVTWGELAGIKRQLDALEPLTARYHAEYRTATALLSEIICDGADARSVAESLTLDVGLHRAHGKFWRNATD